MSFQLGTCGPTASSFQTSKPDVWLFASPAFTVPQKMATLLFCYHCNAIDEGKAFFEATESRHRRGSFMHNGICVEKRAPRSLLKPRNGCPGHDGNACIRFLCDKEHIFLSKLQNYKVGLIFYFARLFPIQEKSKYWEQRARSQNVCQFSRTLPLFLAHRRKITKRSAPFAILAEKQLKTK